MSIETLARPLPAEATFEDRVARIRSDGVTSELNTVLNQRVGLGKQLDEALQRETPLWVANNALDTAIELQAHNNGEITGPLSEATAKALDAGETPDTLLDKADAAFSLFQNRKNSQETHLDYDEELDSARSEYVQLLVKRPRLPGKRKAYRERLAIAEQAYSDAFVHKVTQIMELDENNPKAPYAPPVTRELHKENPDIKELAGNRLHVLVDQLAREQLTKGKMIGEMSNRSAKRVVAALSKSRPLRAVIAGAVFVGTAATMHKGLLPEGADKYTEAVQYAVELIPAYLTIRESVLSADEGLDRLKQRHQMKRDLDELTSSTLLSELALRTLYSGVEYQDGRIPGRNAGDKQQNEHTFAGIDEQFAKLEREGYRGGKPYTAEHVIPYITDLYLRRKEQIDDIVDSQNPQEAFVALCREVITTDTHELTKRQQSSAAKKAAYRALALAGAIVATKWVNQVTSMREMRSAIMSVPQIEANSL